VIFKYQVSPTVKQFNSANYDWH